MTYDINKALESLEENLKKLDSARIQVKNTVDASNELQKVVQGYVASLTTFRNSIMDWSQDLGLAESEFKDKIRNSINTLQLSCDKIEQSFKDSTYEIVSGFKSGTEGILAGFENQNRILGEHVGYLNLLREDLKKSMNEIASIKETVLNIAEELRNSQSGQDSVLSDIKTEVVALPRIMQTHMDELIDHLNTFEQNINNLLAENQQALTNIDTKIGELHNVSLGIKEECSSIGSSIEELKQSTEKWKNENTLAIQANRWILILVFIVLIILHFI